MFGYPGFVPKVRWRMNIVAIIGSQRKNGTTDTVVSEILSAARENGSHCEKIYISDLTLQISQSCRMIWKYLQKEIGKMSRPVY